MGDNHRKRPYTRANPQSEEVGALENKVTALETEKDDLLAQLNHNSGIAVAVEIQAEKDKAENARNVERISALEISLALSGAALVSKEAENEDLKGQRTQLNARITALEDTLRNTAVDAAQERLLLAANQNTEKAEERAKQAEERAKQAEERRTEADARTAKVERDSAESIANISREKAAAEQSLTTLGEKMAAVNNEVGQLRESNTELNAATENLGSQIKSLKGKLEARAKELSETTSTVETLLGENKMLKEANSAMDSRLKAINESTLRMAELLKGSGLGSKK